jgi:hypothetical protein
MTPPGWRQLPLMNLLPRFRTLASPARGYLLGALERGGINQERTAMKIIRYLVGFVKLNPGTTAFLGLLMGGCIALGVWDGFTTDHPWIWGLLGFMAGLFLVTFWRDRNKIIASVLCAITASAQVLASSSAGLFCWATEGYCQPFTPASEEPIHGMTLQIVVEPDADGQIAPRIVNAWHIPESAMVSAEEADAGLRTWGIHWTGEMGEWYATNGVAATAADVPFAISYASYPPSISLYPDRPQFSIVVETSSGLGEPWSPLLATSIPAGVVIHVEDLTRGGQTFYRVRMQAPGEILPAGVIAAGIGLGLLAGGGYICYRVAKCAAKRARDRQPPPTNAPPAMAEMRVN